MPMQVIFPISMVGIGVGAAAATIVLANHMIYKKGHRPVMVDDFDDNLLERDKWVRQQNKINKELRAKMNL